MSLEKLKSRKLWATLAAYVVVALNDVLEIGLDKETIYSLVAIVSGYNVGQGIADMKGTPVKP